MTSSLSEFLHTWNISLSKQVSCKCVKNSSNSLTLPVHSYFIPEDGDEEQHPNVFLAPKPRQPGAPPTLGQVKDAFPLPGRYHFRFKAPLYPGGDREKGAMAVWMDIVRDNVAVPTWKNGVVTKVTRLSVEEDDDDDDDDFGHSPVAAPAPTRAPPPQPSHRSAASTGSADHVDLFGNGPSPSSAAPAAAAPAPNLFDHTPPPSAPASGGSLLDFGAVPPAPAPAAAHSDFLGMTAPPQGGYPQQRPPPMQQQPMAPPMQQRPQGQSFNTGYSQQQQQNQPFGGLNWS